MNRTIAKMLRRIEMKCDTLLAMQGRTEIDELIDAMHTAARTLREQARVEKGNLL